MRTPRFSSRTLARALAAAAAAFAFPRTALAWSANGHKTVALIAESRLSPQAKAAVAAILGPTATLDSIAPCADDIRGKTGYDCSGITLDDDPQSEPWHFINIPITDSPSDGAALDQYCPVSGSAVSAQSAPKRRRPSPSAGGPGSDPGGAGGAPPAGACVRDQINKDVSILKTSSVLGQRQLALMFLVHFVGDEHQPLHCADEIVDGVNDRGGNLKNVNFEGTAMDLHALWDHQILPEDTNDPGQTSARLIADLQGKDVSSWTSGDFVSAAALESFNVAKTVVYPAYYAQDPNSLGAAYQQQMQPIVDDRLERAGVRLAALLETALAGAPAASPAPGDTGDAVRKARRRVQKAESDSAP